MLIFLHVVHLRILDRLYRESSAYVYSLLKDEVNHGEFVQTEI